MRPCGFESHYPHHKFAKVVADWVFGCVAQLVRALRSHRRGRWFESNHIHHVFCPRFGAFFVDNEVACDIVLVMKSSLQKFYDKIELWFGKKKINAKPFNEITSADKQRTTVPTEMSLKDMLSLSNEFVFHGSNVCLQPGVDVLMPTKRVSGKVLCLGDFDTALRFALVRTYGQDQLSGKDFYVLSSPSYKLVIYDGFLVRPDWFRRPVEKSGYMYAVRRSDVENVVSAGGRAMEAEAPAPIASRAVVNQQTMAEAGYGFVAEMFTPIKRWWNVPETDEFVKHVLLPEYDDIIFYRDRQR